MSRLVAGREEVQSSQAVARGKGRGSRARSPPPVQPPARDCEPRLPGIWTLLVFAAGSAASAGGLDEARTEKEMKPYKQLMAGTDVEFDMVPIRGGSLHDGKSARRRKATSPTKDPRTRCESSHSGWASTR